MKKYRIFVRDRGRKYSAFKPVTAHHARAAVRGLVVPDWISNPNGYYKAIEWPAKSADDLRWLKENV
jgi:hypothetical protein